MLRLRPYKPCDAQRITDWITDEYGFRQWCADCYERYPISPEDMNRRYDSERDSDGSWAMTAFDEGGPAGHPHNALSGRAPGHAALRLCDCG